MLRLCFSISVCAETQPVSVCDSCFLSLVTTEKSWSIFIHFRCKRCPLCILPSGIYTIWSSWAFSKLKAFPYRRVATVPSLALWPFDGLYPICPCPSCSGKLRPEHSIPGVSSSGLSRGNGCLPSTCLRQPRIPLTFCVIWAHCKLGFLVNFGFQVGSHIAVICAPEAWGVLSWLKADPAAFEHFSLLHCFNLRLLRLSLPSAIASFAKPLCILSTTDRKAVVWCSMFLHSDNQDEFRENQCRGSKLWNHY